MAKKEEVIYDEQGACPCKSCKRKKITSYPTVFEVSGLFYARCSCETCTKYDLYAFIGITKKDAIRNWNDTMEHHETPIKEEE